MGFLQGLQGKKPDSEPGLVIWPPACVASAGRIQEAVPGLVPLRHPQVNEPERLILRSIRKWGRGDEGGGKGAQGRG